MQLVSPTAQAEIAVIISALTVKLPLIGTFSSAWAGLGIGARAMAASASRTREIEIAFLFENKFRNIFALLRQTLNEAETDDTVGKLPSLPLVRFAYFA
jgi:hypothetical protein